MLKNAIWMIIGEGLVKSFQYFINFLIARNLSVDQYGYFNDIFSLTQILMVFADFGMSVVLVKKITNKESAPKEVFEQNFSFKLFLMVFLIAIMAIYAAFTDRAQIPSYLLLAGYNVLQFGYTPFIYSFNRAKKDFKFETLLKISSLIFTATSLIFFLHEPSLTNASIPYLVTPLVPSIIATFIFFKKYRYKPEINPFRGILDKIKEYHSIIIANSAIMLFSVIPFQYIGSYSNHELGIFSAAFRFIIPLTLVANLLNTSFLPNIKKNKFAISKGKLLLLVGLILSSIFFGVLLSPLLISVLYGEKYIEAVQPLRILLLYPVILFVNSLLQNILLVNSKVQLLNQTSLFGVILMVILLIFRNAEVFKYIPINTYVSIVLIISISGIVIPRSLSLISLSKTFTK